MDEYSIGNNFSDKMKRDYSEQVTKLDALMNGRLEELEEIYNLKLSNMREKESEL